MVGRSLLVCVLVVLGSNCFRLMGFAAPTPIFYTSLDDDASITDIGGGIRNIPRHTYVPGAIGNAFESTSSDTNYGGWARWTDSDVSTIFSNWNDANGITIDHYFSGSWTGLSGPVDEGFWAIVRRNTLEPTSTGNGQYFFTSVRTGKLRIAFANNADNEYKYTFDGSAPSGTEYAPGLDLPLSDNTIYHLTVSIGAGVFQVWLDDVGGDQYSNAAPVFTDSTTLPSDYNWQLPPAGAVPNSGNETGRQTREMDIGIRGYGNSAGTVNNFGGTLRDGDWVDEVSIYNGVYTPEEISQQVAPLPGDYNLDGIVDAADYIMWRKTLGQSVSPNGSGADGDGDGTIGPGDYDVWRGQFGNVPAGGSYALAVPEPTTLVLAGIVACASAWIGCFVGRRGSSRRAFPACV